MSTDVLSFFASLDYGVSEDAQRRDRALTPLADVSSSRSVLDRTIAFESLDNAYREAGSHDWDYEGGAPADAMSYRYACLLLRQLPAWVQNPEASVDPDGEISLDWYRGRGWAFSVSVGRDGTLSYAALFGASSQRGVESFVGEIPENILASLRRAVTRSGI